MNCSACKFDNSEGRGVCRLIEAAGVRGLRSYDCPEFEEKETDKMHHDDKGQTTTTRTEIENYFTEKRKSIDRSLANLENQRDSANRQIAMYESRLAQLNDDCDYFEGLFE